MPDICKYTLVFICLMGQFEALEIYLSLSPERSGPSTKRPGMSPGITKRPVTQTTPTESSTSDPATASKRPGSKSPGAPPSPPPDVSGGKASSMHLPTELLALPNPKKPTKPVNSSNSTDFIRVFTELCVCEENWDKGSEANNIDTNEKSRQRRSALPGNFVVSVTWTDNDIDAGTNSDSPISQSCSPSSIAASVDKMDLKLRCKQNNCSVLTFHSTHGGSCGIEEEIFSVFELPLFDQCPDFTTPTQMLHATLWMKHQCEFENMTFDFHYQSWNSSSSQSPLFEMKEEETIGCVTIWIEEAEFPSGIPIIPRIFRITGRKLCCRFMKVGKTCHKVKASMVEMLARVIASFYELDFDIALRIITGMPFVLIGSIFLVSGICFFRKTRFDNIRAVGGNINHNRIPNQRRRRRRIYFKRSWGT